MFKHNIGKIFLYNVPPDQTQFDVRVSLFNADELMQPELLLQLEDESLTPVAQRRKRAITDASALPTSVLSTWAEFGIDELNRLADVVSDEIRTPLSSDRAFSTARERASMLAISWKENGGRDRD